MGAVGRDSAPGCCHRLAFSSWRRSPTRLLQLPTRAVLLSSLVIDTTRQRRLRALAHYWRWQLVRQLGGRAVLIDLMPSVPLSVPGRPTHAESPVRLEAHAGFGERAAETPRRAIPAGRRGPTQLRGGAPD